MATIFRVNQLRAKRRGPSKNFLQSLPVGKKWEPLPGRNFTIDTLPKDRKEIKAMIIPVLIEEGHLVPGDYAIWAAGILKKNGSALLPDHHGVRVSMSDLKFYRQNGFIKEELRS